MQYVESLSFSSFVLELYQKLPIPVQVKHQHNNTIIVFLMQRLLTNLSTAK